MRRFALLLMLGLAAFGQTAAEFALKDGDRVVFYGDSITDQRLYTTFAETYVVTRFPGRKINFVHSGWGGDRVSGGGGGNIDVRLPRDVFAYKPNVVTIMLGMNDGRYRSYDAGVYENFITGYESMVKKIKTALPGVRITAIRPSPYDEVTRDAMKPLGYNPVLIQFGNWIQEFAKREGLAVADLNSQVVTMLGRAKAADAAQAERIIPDRVHPGAAGHLIMAGELLKSWNATARVSSVTIDAAAGAVKEALRAKVTGVSGTGGLSWTQMDESLPMPVDWEDPVVKLAVNSSDFMNALNRQDMRVNGLAAGWYALAIDGRHMAVFSADELARGINLATLATPMMQQAAAVHALTLKHNNVHFARWRTLQVPLAGDNVTKMQAAMTALDALEDEIVAKQRAAAVPVAHKFELVPASESMKAIPTGFNPIFNGRDFSGWHISAVNHHGDGKGWSVKEGVLTGTQDRPRNGGILLTDKRYKNYEVFMEILPDFGCDGGLFLRATEKGEAYQVMLDYLEGGNVGGIYGERLTGVRGQAADYQSAWTTGGWNSLRARIEGEIPRIRVWINGKQVTDWQANANNLPGGVTDGMIAVQVHGGSRWREGGQHRFRNVAIKELP